TIGRVIMIVSPRVKRQFVEQFDVERRVIEQIGVSLTQYGKRGSHDLLIWTGRDTGAAKVERNRPDPLMFIRLAGRAGVQDRDGAIADVIVQVLHDRGGQCGSILWGQRARGNCRQGHFTCRGEKERREYLVVRLMS